MRSAVYKNGNYIKNWSDDESLTIAGGNNVALSWVSTNATACTASGGFTVPASDIASGRDWEVTEPTPGNSTTYTITCTSEGGSAEASVTVTTSTISSESVNPAVYMWAAVYQGRNYLKSWGMEDITIMPGNQVALYWQTDSVTSCSASDGFTVGPNAIARGVDWYVTEPTSGSRTTYTLTCTGGVGIPATDSITVTSL